MKKMHKILSEQFGEDQIVLFENVLADIDRNMLIFDFLGYADGVLVPERFNPEVADFICERAGLTVRQMAENMITINNFLMPYNMALEEFVLEAKINSRMRHWGEK